MKLYKKLTQYPLGAIKAEGYLKEQMIRGKNGMAGHLYELEPAMINDPYLKDFSVGAWSETLMLGWGAEISGNYWAGYIQHAFVLNDEEMIKKATDWVNKALQKQRDDGYFGVYYKHDEGLFEDFNSWGTSRALRGLLAFYEATGREDVFNAVYNCVKWFVKNWAGDKKTAYAGGSIIEVCVYCYYVTGDMSLIDFCVDYQEFLAKNNVYHNSYKEYLEEELRYYSNHTAALGTHMSLPALIYSATGEEKYLKASERIIKLVREKAVHLSGGAISNAEYLAAKSPLYGTEYCSNQVYNNSYSKMLYITGDAIYGDYMEEVFYNSVQGGRKKDEKAIAYMSAPNQIFATDTSTISGADPDMDVYAPCYSTSCCPVMSVLVVPEFVRNMMMHDDSGNVYVCAYGPCVLDYNGITVRAVTDYPFRNTAKFEIACDKEITLFLKIPVWAKGYKIQINGKNVDAKKNCIGYAEVKNVKNDDIIEICFDAEVEVIRVDDKDAGNKQPIAFKYGALLYSLHIKELWTEIEGTPNTPLPKGWSWYNARYVKPDDDPDCPANERTGRRRYKFEFNVAVDENIDPKSITVAHIDKNGYVWENPMIKLHAHCYRAPFAYPTYPKKTYEPFGDKQYVTEKIPLELVPYGCTNLRITYFPRADLDNK